jgi:hypothetical protein
MADPSQMSPAQVLSSMIDDAVRKAMVETRTHVPATVLSFARRPPAGRAEVSVRIDMLARLRTGETMQIPQVDRVPVLWPGGGGWVMDADLSPGDQVVLEVMDRDIAGWLESGDLSEPATGVLHAVTVCAALAVTLRSDAKVASARPGAGAMYLGTAKGTPPWIRLGTLPTPKLTLQAPAIALGEGATLGVARQTDPVTPDADWLAWFAAVASFTGIPVPVPPLGVPFARITTASTVSKSL